MTDRLNDTIQAIAVKHGVMLSKDDPILILQTMNDRLLEDTRKAQEAMLKQFREEIEQIASQWKDDARKKAEKILNSALSVSKEVFIKAEQNANLELATAIQKIVDESKKEFENLIMNQRLNC